MPDMEINDEGDDLQAMQAVFGSHFAEIAALFQSDSPKRIAALHESVNDAKKLAQIAHTLSGSCASIGAKKLATLCQALEAKAKSGANAQEVVAELQAIATEYVGIECKLQSLLQTV